MLAEMGLRSRRFRLGGTLRAAWGHFRPSGQVANYGRSIPENGRQ